jgi:hypothetical protein
LNESNSLELVDIPEELRLILDLLKADDSINQQSLENIDWNILMNQAMHHRVFPLLYRKLAKINEKIDVPAFVIDFLYEQYRRNTLNMLHFSAEMEYVSDLLTKHDIPLLFLKGPTLGHDLYGDISLRTSGDLDILVPIDRLTYIEELLVQAGYEKDDYIKTILNDWKWRHHHVAYIHPDKQIKLEVHWRLSPGPAKEPSFNDLWKRRSKSLLTDHPVYTLGNEDLFLFLASHGARHGWSRLRWLMDIHQLANQKLDWSDIHKQCNTYDSFNVCGQSIILTAELLGTKIPKGTESTFRTEKCFNLAEQALFYFESMINLHTEPVPKTVSRYHKRYLFSLMPGQQKLLFMLSFLYPYPEDKETLPLPRQLHVLYFPLRPLLWAWRKTKDYALS